MNRLIKKRGIPALLLASVLIVMALAGCGSEPAAKGTGVPVGNPAPELQEKGPEPIVIQDSNGKSFTFDKPVERVVILNRNAAEAMKILQVEDRIAAIGDNVHRFNTYLGLNDLPNIGTTSQVSYEAIIALQPEVVLAFTNRPTADLEEKLEPAGIRVVRLDLYRPETTTDDFLQLAAMFGKDERAREFVAWKQAIEDVLADGIKDVKTEDRPRGIALSTGALNNLEYNVFTNEVGEGYGLVLAGAVNLGSAYTWDGTASGTSIKISPEFIIEQNPDFVTLNGTAFGGYEIEHPEELLGIVDKALRESVLPQTTAGQEKRLYYYHTNIIGSDRYYIGTLALAKQLYPDRFARVDPAAYDREYFERWIGIPYKGVWMYAFSE